MSQTKRFSGALISTLLACALVLASRWVSADVNDLSIICYDQTDATSWCEDQTCSIYVPLAPNQGWERRATWQCCYENGQLVSAPNYRCVDQEVVSDTYPYGCCTIVTRKPLCPPLYCEPEHPE